MSKFIVTVFDDEKSAYEGSKALSDLDRDGNVVCYAAAVIAKDAQGAVQVKDGADEGPVGTLLGMLVGGLVGALGGPQTMVAGWSSGLVEGMLTPMASKRAVMSCAMNSPTRMPTAMTISLRRFLFMIPLDSCEESRTLRLLLQS